MSSEGLEQRIERIWERYGFRLPEVFLQLLMRGSFDPFKEAYVQLSDLLWLPPGQIADYRFHRNQIEGLIPFARTAQEDLWCFFPDLDAEVDGPVVYCPDEDEVAHIYAPDFEAFLYRRLLDEYACTGLTEHYDLQQSRSVLRGYIDGLAPFLRSDWIERLRGIDARPWNKDANGYYGTVDEDELAEIIATDIGYGRIDEEFEQFVDD